MSLSATVSSSSLRGSLLCAPKEVEGIFFRNNRTMSKLVKRLQNGTDFEVCVFETKKNGFAVTIWDSVAREYQTDCLRPTLEEAVSKAEELNESYKIN